MKRRILAGIALMLTLAMLSGSGLSALADAPEALDEIFEEIEAVQDGEGEAADEVELIPEDEDVLMLEGDDPLIEDLTGDDLALDGLADLELSDPELLDSGLSEELLVGDTEGATEEAALGLAADETGSDNVETSAEGTVEAVTTSGGMDNDALFEAWIRQRLPGLAPRRTYASAQSGRAGLDGLNLILYDALAPMVKKVAEGKRTSTQFAVTLKADTMVSWWTAEQLGLKEFGEISVYGPALLEKEGFINNKITRALLADYPYHLYWYQKTTGGGTAWNYSVSFNTVGDVRYVRLSTMTARMAVAQDYASQSEAYTVNELPARVTAASNNINGIIEANRSKGDYAKVTAYADEVCRLVEYNHAAADNDDTPYGDPWQLVFIFDGDDDTKVVCEGYSKGFKYLCDLSEFDGDVYCELVSGTIPVNGVAGGHMWNSLRMPDGRTYLVDLTNSDGGGSCSKRYFLKGCTGEPGKYYTCNGLRFTYKDETVSTLSIDWLTMSGADYGKGYTVEASAEHGTLTAEPAIADAGQTVTLTVTPDAGYGAAKPTVKLGKQSLGLQQAGTNRWSFTMPYGDVTAEATCKKIITVSGIIAADKVYDGGTDATLDCDNAQFEGIMEGDSLTVTATGAFEDKTAGEGKTVTISGLTLGGDDAANYVLAASGNQTEATANITPKPVTVTGLTVADKEYDGTTEATITGEATISGTLEGDDVDVRASGVAFEDKTAGDGKTVTISGLTLGGDDAANYVLAASGNQAEATANITPKPVTVTGLSVADKVYDGTTDATVTGEATISGRLDGDDVDVRATGVAFKDKNAGVGKTVTFDCCELTGADAGNYRLAEQVSDATANITAKEIGLEWGEDAFTYDGDVHVPAATATGLLEGDACTVTVTGGQKNAGSYTATASALSNGNYALPEANTHDFTVGIRLVTVSGIVAGDKEYDGTADATLDCGNAGFEGIVEGDSLTVTAAGAFADKTAGEGKTVTISGLALGGADAANYALAESGNQAEATASITPKPVTVTGLSVADKVYDGTTDATVTGEATISGTLEGDDVDVRASGVAFADRNVGTGKTVTFESCQLIGEDAGNYRLAEQVSDATADITAREIGLEWSEETFTYDGDAHVPAATATGLLEGDACAVTVTGGQKDAGSYTATATALSNRNYALPAAATKAYTIKPKTATLKWSNTTLFYNAKTQLPAAAVGNLLSGDACAVTVTGGKKDAGSYTATATGLSNGNYALPAIATKAYTIKPKTATLKWSSTILTYNGKTQKPAATVGNLLSGDACAVTVTGGKKNAGSYTATATALSNKNYALPATATKAYTIKPKTVTLKWSNTTLTYNAKTQKPTATVGNLLSGDACTVTVTGGKKNAGSYTATATRLSNKNYALPATATKAYTIKPKTVILKWSNTTLTYNGKAQKPTVTAAGLVSGDTCTVTVTGSRKSAGSYTAQATGLSNKNYALPTVKTKTCTIRKKTVSLKWTNTSLKYNGKSQKPTATAVGLITGDKCTVTVIGARIQKGTYTAQATRLSNLNYQLPAKATVQFRIY